jgi:S1-C subfamily serine protease
MIEEKYQLIKRDSRPNLARWRRATGRVGWISAIALLLLSGALYGPVLWQQSGVTAEPEAAAPATIGTGAPVRQEVASLINDQEVLADLYDQIAPSVVHIQVVSEAREIFPGFGLPENGGEPQLEQSLGSGFIYDDLGHIVTNNHVVERSQEVLVLFSNGYWADAEVVATDPQSDLAVIRVTPPDGVDWQPLPLAEPDALRVGYTVIAIGNPFGLDGTMTTGIVSAIERGVPVGEGEFANYTLPDVIQTDAAINPGNSGGPLLDLAGNVVGINFAIRSQVPSNTGVGFAIPVSIVRRVVPALIENGRYAYAYLGLSGTSINPILARALDLPDNQLGIYVATVIPGGPSDEAGILGGSETITDENGLEFAAGGDIITAVDDLPVQRFEDLVSFLVTEASPGQVITLTVQREGETLQVPVTLGERPSGSAEATPQVPDENGINAREAIEIATDAAEEQQLLTSDIVERIASPDVLDGVDVWVVELVTDNETVVVTVDTLTGEVIDLEVR